MVITLQNIIFRLIVPNSWRSSWRGIATDSWCYFYVP